MAKDAHGEIYRGESEMEGGQGGSTPISAF